MVFQYVLMFYKLKAVGYFAFIRFVKVLGAHVTHVLLKAGLPAWLLPALPVAITFIIEPQLYRGGDRL